MVSSLAPSFGGCSVRDAPGERTVIGSWAHQTPRLACWVVMPASTSAWTKPRAEPSSPGGSIAFTSTRQLSIRRPARPGRRSGSTAARARGGGGGTARRGRSPRRGRRGRGAVLLVERGEDVGADVQAVADVHGDEGAGLHLAGDVGSAVVLFRGEGVVV